MKKVISLLLFVTLIVGAGLPAQETPKPDPHSGQDETRPFSNEAVFVRVSGDRVVLQQPTQVPPPETPLPLPIIRPSPKVTEISADRWGSVSVVTARWGAFNGWVDVTERVRAFVKNGRLVIPHVPDSLGPLQDPASGHHKALIVVYRQGQETRLAIVPSQGKLNLPEIPSNRRQQGVNVVGNSAPQGTATLVGITRDAEDQIGLVNIDTATGKTTPVLSVSVGEFECYSLTYHTPSRRFLTVSVRSSTLGIFDPQLETFTKVAIVGLPAGQEKLSGITYQHNNDRILISFGASDGNHENRIAQINLQGEVLRISADLQLGDRDFLSGHPQSGDLIAIDFNGKSPRIATVVDPFGKLSTISFGNPPRDSQLVDLAITSPQGRMFTIRQNTRELVEIVERGNRFSTIGSFQTKVEVVGIAAVPSDLPTTLLGQQPQTNPWKPVANSLKAAVFESVLGVYGQAIRGQRFPFVNLRPPDRNLWTEEIESKLRGTLSYGQVDYTGTAKLVIPETGTYTIDLPARGTQLKLNGFLLKLGDVQLQKGVYDVEIYTNHWGQPYLKYAHANVYKYGTRTKIPFVNTAAAIKKFRSQKIDSRRVVEVCDYDLKRVRVVRVERDFMLQFADRRYAGNLAIRVDKHINQRLPEPAIP